MALTREQLKKQEAAFQQQIDTQHKALEAREAAIAEAAATIAEREALLAEVNAELAAARAELAKAKAANLKVPDDHDYNEADTRKHFIDVLLREAGWEVAKRRRSRCRSPGCLTRRARASSITCSGALTANRRPSLRPSAR